AAPGCATSLERGERGDEALRARNMASRTEPRTTRRMMPPCPAALRHGPLVDVPAVRGAARQLPRHIYEPTGGGGRRGVVELVEHEDLVGHVMDDVRDRPHPLGPGNRGEVAINERVELRVHVVHAVLAYVPV